MDSAIIELVVGLVLAYSLASIVVSQINEFIQTLLQQRSKFLINALNEMLTKGNLPGKGLLGLLRTLLEPEPRGVVSGETASKSFIEKILEHPLIYSFDKEGNRVATTTYIDPKHLATAIQQILHGGAEVPESIKEMLASLTGQPFEELTKSLKGLTGEAFDKAKENLERNVELIRSWVDKQFDKMTQIYKRKIFVFSLFIGLILASVLNMDSIQMVQILWKDPTLRAAVVQTAGQVAADTGEATASSGEEEIETAAQDARNAVSNLLNAQLPIRWLDASEVNDSLYPPGRDPRVWADVLNNGDLQIMKIVGLLITGLAISLGSDFWFNLLRNLMGQGSGSSK